MGRKKLAEEAPKNDHPSRDQIRSKLFGKKHLKSRVIEIFGTQVEVRQPSIGQILEMQDVQSDKQQNQMVRMLIQHCYVPGTNEKVFDDADADSILEWPFDDWFNKFNDAITELTSIDVKGAEKN